MDSPTPSAAVKTDTATPAQFKKDVHLIAYISRHRMALPIQNSPPIFLVTSDRGEVAALHAEVFTRPRPSPQTSQASDTASYKAFPVDI